MESVASNKVGELTDEALMARIAQDDSAAFDALFMRYHRGVYNFLLRLVMDREQAEDLTQTCFLRVWRARRGYQPTATFGTWLFTIARRLALDALKRSSLPIAANTDAAILSPTGTQLSDAAMERLADPQAVTLTRELQRLIADGVDALPLELKEVLLLRGVEGLQYEQIASVLGWPLGTVKSRLNIARGRLRAIVLAWQCDA